MSIKVLIADDQPLLVAGFRKVLGGSVDLVGVAQSLDEVVAAYAKLKPQVLIIDIALGGNGADQRGLAVCGQLLGGNPRAQIVVFTQFDDQYIIEKSYKVGVLAFVRKNESAEVLQEAIQTASNGSQYFSPAIARLLAVSAIKDTNPEKLLSSSELRVFILTADGATQSQLANLLDVSLKTVSTLFNGVKVKLGVETHADITKLAIQYGLTTTQRKAIN